MFPLMALQISQPLKHLGAMTDVIFMVQEAGK